MRENWKLIKQGAEAKVYATEWNGLPALIKEIQSKEYRHPVLDKAIISQRMRNEIKCIVWCSELDISVPNIYHMDIDKQIICMEHITPSILVKEYLIELLKDEFKHLFCLSMLAKKIGIVLAKLHSNNMIHGDLTTSNMLIRLENDDIANLKTLAYEKIPLVVIDFGLGQKQVLPEDLAVDLFVMETTLLSTHPTGRQFLDDVLSNYFNELNRKLKHIVKTKLEQVRNRRRKKLAIG